MPPDAAIAADGRIASRATLLCRNLSVAAPLNRIVLPLPIPVSIPAWSWIKRQGPDVEAAAEDKRLLLSNVSLEVPPGDLMAIIGGSGSGKTTLLNSLTQRPTNLVVKQGSVAVVPEDATSLQSASLAYVKQEDRLLPTLTCRETLAYAAKLCLPTSLDASARDAIVDQTLRDLGLQDVGSVRVGMGRGLSGGERRRLTIACALVRSPSVLVLDEPTTGLDSSSSHQVLVVLKKLARGGRSIIITVHAPRSDAFELFDQLLILAQGKSVFCGKTIDALPYFADLGYNLPDATNPLDFLIDVTSIDERDLEREAQSSKRVSALRNAWAKEMQENGPPEDGATKRRSRLSVQFRQHTNRPGTFSQAVTLTRRGLLFIRRDWGQNLGYAVQFIVLAVAMGAAFYRPPETPGGIQSLKTNIFQSIVCTYYLSFIIYIYVLCKLLVVFDREREDQLYDSTVAYLVSLVFTYLPVNVIYPTIFSVIFYFMSGLRQDDLAANLFSYIASNIMQQLAAFGYALCAASINRSFAQASLLANGIVIAWILTAGYIVTPIPVWVSWMRWLHPYFYGFNWQARTQFQGRVFACAGDGSIESSQCIGDNVLVGLRFDPNTPLWVFPLGLLGFILVIHVLALLILTTWHPGGQRHATQQHSMQVEGVLKESNEKAATTKQHQLLVQLQHVTLGVTTGSLLSRDSATQKKILDDINLEFAPGRLSGILGPSGAGKSSLLSLLSARLSHKDFHMTGRICLNDQPLSKGDVQRIAFVQQDDSHLLPALTVRETLHYSALLKLDHLPVRSRRARAEEVILQLGLKHCADNLIGGELVKGISGGEKRRVSLGLELLSDPAVLVADEPTSGLDAAQALSVIDCLRTVASTGTVVIASLHQPRSAIFNALDHIVLLAKGGRVVCCGTGTEVSKHFEAVGLAVPKHFGLADFYLDSITVNAQDKATQAKSSELVDTLVDNWRFKQNDPAVETATASSGIAATATQTHPIWNVLPVILPRNFKNLRRQSDVFVTRLANPPFLGLLFFLFFGRFSLAPSSVQSRIGFLQELSAMPFVGCLSAVAIYGNELGSFLHDYRSSGARYSAASFLATYTLIEVPMQLIGSFLFAVVSVFGMGLQHSVKDFFEFTVSVFAVINFGESVGILFGTWVQDALSVSLISTALSVAAQTSGIFSVTVPQWLAIIGCAFPFKWAARIVAINEYSGLRFDCGQADIASGLCLAADGDSFLTTIGIVDRSTGKYMAIVLSLAISGFFELARPRLSLTVWRILGWLSLVVRLRLL